MVVGLTLEINVSVYGDKLKRQRSRAGIRKVEEWNRRQRAEKLQSSPGKITPTITPNTDPVNSVGE